MSVEQVLRLKPELGELHGVSVLAHQCFHADIEALHFIVYYVVNTIYVGEDSLIQGLLQIREGGLMIDALRSA